MLPLEPTGSATKRRSNKANDPTHVAVKKNPGRGGGQRHLSDTLEDKRQTAAEPEEVRKAPRFRVEVPAVHKGNEKEDVVGVPKVHKSEKAKSSRRNRGGH